MVFSGRPSSACHACRATRLKCDRVRTGCMQCARKKKLCPGYVNLSQLRLRDETDRVTRKVQEAINFKADSLRKPQRTIRCPSLALNHAKKPDSKTRALSNITHHPQVLNVLSDFTDDAAITYFITSYIVSSPFSGYLQDLYTKDQVIDDALSSAIYAASFATFALRTGDYNYLNKGRSRYSLALARTNVALKNPESAVLDRTLAAVLLLGLFESTVFVGRSSPVEWTTHMTGALGLLQLRGLQQFKSNVAQKLFNHAANNIRTCCIQRKIKVYDELLVLNQSAMLFLGPKDPSIRFSALLDKTATIRAQIRNSSRLLESRNYDFLQEALNLDHEARELMDDPEHKLTYTVRSIEDTPSWAYLHTACQYPNFRVAKFWNAIRMVRLCFNEIVWSISSKAVSKIKNSTGDTALGNELEKYTYFESLKDNAVKNLTDIATGVLTSIPDFVEPHPSGRRFSPAARTLAWPLYLLYECPACPSEARIYARDMLEELVKDLHMPQVLNAAKLDIDSGNPNNWLHLYHLD
ncbi:hypothetical protein V8C37DRAFT_396546 [Trichoderma ceciliae]